MTERLEVVCVGKPVKGHWWACPASLMPHILSSSGEVGVLLAEEASPSPRPDADVDFLGIDDEEGSTLYYPANPPVVFTLQHDDIEYARERVRAGEDAEMVTLELYANARAG